MIALLSPLRRRTFLLFAFMYTIFQCCMWHNDFPIITTRLAIYIDCPSRNYSISNAEYLFVKAPVQQIPKNKQAPRLAVCMTGGLRVLPEIWPTMHQIFAKIDENYLLFLHLSNFETLSQEDLEYLHEFNSSGVVSLTSDTKLTKPLLPTVRFLTTLSDLQKMIQQMQSLKECYNSVEEYSQQYSVDIKYLMRTRSDTVITNPLDSMQSIPDIINDIDDGHIVLPDTQHDWFRGYNDRIAIGPFKTMRHLMRRIDHLWPGSQVFQFFQNAVN